MTQKDLFSSLGCRATDKVTGKLGTITSISFDLYGCVQFLLMPNVGDSWECFWLDINRVRIEPGDPVMDQPDFNTILGPEDKPIQ